MAKTCVSKLPAATDEVRLLIAELEAVLAAEYPPERRHGFSVEAIFNRTSGSSSYGGKALP